ncbi:23S rRNA (adenine(2030)-N(6))-methyltransferase RlmJ, partial [Morganella morganii]|uniref:23S rRNA (adenine(2030)-N(6))-methyltransferase RlmJ n=2 Tax=Morganellaceae TaxID=1903414 RepID=UPI003EBE26C2
DKPFLYLDTHAGAGRYQLSGEHAERTGEYLEGIARIWAQESVPEELKTYLEAVSALNPRGDLRFYPGSPLIAAHLLRDHDKLNISELHPSDFPLLRNEFSRDNRARVVREDGYQQLKSQLPPLSRRGFVLIDPPYELKSDYQAVVKGIQEGHRRFATGTYAVWYPVVLRQQIKRMVKDFQATGIRKILQIELAVRPDSDQRGMTASGMIVINPPWKLESQIKSVLPWLHKVLVPEGTGHTLVEWITPE